MVGLAIDQITKLYECSLIDEKFFCGDSSVSDPVNTLGWGNV